MLEEVVPGKGKGKSSLAKLKGKEGEKIRWIFLEEIF